jgi:hypothetical protein
MSDRMLLDTDVLIEFLRLRPNAVSFIKALRHRPFMSVIVVSELYAGVREGPEREQLDKLVAGFRVVPVTREIALAAGLYVRQYRPSHGTGLSDAIIAATAEAIGAELFTFNTRHYPMLPDAVAPYPRI